jgi:hypothetical protein
MVACHFPVQPGEILTTAPAAASGTEGSSIAGGAA